MYIFLSIEPFTRIWSISSTFNTFINFILIEKFSGKLNYTMWSRKNAVTHLVANSSKSSNWIGHRLSKSSNSLGKTKSVAGFWRNGDQVSYWILMNRRPSELLHFSETTSNAEIQTNFFTFGYKIIKNNGFIFHFSIWFFCFDK